ncbi:hypothetical protein Dvina_27725 [Dactylosporangium vinaceum]|uniref:Secreted protein n=1 Tax=Dactylosporangium vinaceum TaxID=53362 RepID=A0ABV5MCH1_9ACTN|nr:hypothetical protein [Dactylosporangium vinaceum]UAB92173.1 hypothetical protein Dvina_27725 [Dactylosporangium vinaceum]
MRNTQRILALGAMTLTAGAVLGMTATAASAATGQGSQPAAVQPGPHDHDHDGQFGDHNGQFGDHDGNFGDRRDDHVRTWIAGRYNSKKTCNFFAWVGERQGRFDDGKCVPAFNGRRGGWLLIAKDYGRHHGHR